MTFILRSLCRSRLVVLAAALTLVAAGCGSGDDTATDAATADEPEILSTDEDPQVDESEPEADVETDADESEPGAAGEIDEDSLIEFGSGPIELAFDGLEPLGSGFVYEAWAIVDGSPVSAGRFDIDNEGNQLFATTTAVEDPSLATAIVVTIEPETGDDPAPAEAHVLAGDVVDGVAELTTAHPEALGLDLSTVGGELVLATPTTVATDDELSGLWFIRLGPTRAGLDLPLLPTGWVYEGWAVIDGQPITTGRFTDPASADDFAGFSGADGSGPAFPGEDFITGAPDGLAFPLDLTGSMAVISVEPAVDDSPEPFALQPLAVEVPAGIGDHQPVVFGPGPALPTGRATIG